MELNIVAEDVATPNRVNKLRGVERLQARAEQRKKKKAARRREFKSERTEKFKKKVDADSRNAAVQKQKAHAEQRVGEQEAGVEQHESAEAGGSARFYTNQQNIDSSLFTKEERLSVEVAAKKTTRIKKKKGKSRVSLEGEPFSSLDISERILKALESMKISKMTVIQGRAIPELQRGRDALMKAETGAGKTLAFAVPMIHDIQSSRISRVDGTLGMVIAPTRELALQLFEVIQAVSRPFPWIVPGIVTGGEKKKSEKARLRKGITILVCTPGRVLDHLQNSASFVIRSLRWLVLDEADRLLDMGFERDLVKILENINTRSQAQRQTILLSATLTNDVQRLAKLSMKNPVHVDAGGDHEDIAGVNNEEALQAVPSQLQQMYTICPSKLRLVTLVAFLWEQLQTGGKILVFFAACDEVEFHHTLFAEVFKDDEDDEGGSPSLVAAPVHKLHGNMSQTSRTSSYRSFCNDKSSVLFCTDVAARGLDLPDVDWIVQYDCPAEVTDYVHRVGRTARIGKGGSSMIFVSPTEEKYIDFLQERGLTLEGVHVGTLLNSLRTFPLALPKGKTQCKVESAAINLQSALEKAVASDPEVQQSARAAFTAYVRAYSTHSASTKHIFHIKSLHLGHLAKSFALREAPTQVARSKGAKRSKKEFYDIHRKKKPKLRAAAVSEFGGGGSGATKKKKKKKRKNDWDDDEEEEDDGAPQAKRPKLAGKIGVSRRMRTQDTRPVGPQW